MNRNAFWQKHLLIVSILITAFGLFMAFFNQTALFDFFNQQIDRAFWSSASQPVAVASFQGWVYGVWGATIAGWGVILTFIVHIAFKQGQRWAWNCLVVGLGLWFVLDTGISWWYGVTFNIVFNIVIAAAIGLPLVFT